MLWNTASNMHSSLYLPHTHSHTHSHSHTLTHSHTSHQAHCCVYRQLPPERRTQTRSKSGQTGLTWHANLWKQNKKRQKYTKHAGKGVDKSECSKYRNFGKVFSKKWLIILSVVGGGVAYWSSFGSKISQNSIPAWNESPSSRHIFSSMHWSERIPVCVCVCECVCECD